METSTQNLLSSLYQNASVDLVLKLMEVVGCSALGDMAGKGNGAKARSIQFISLSLLLRYIRRNPFT